MNRLSTLDGLTAISNRVHVDRLIQRVEGESVDALYKRVDDAMYKSKEMGRNRVYPDPGE